MELFLRKEFIMDRKEMGKLGERLASEYLAGKGCKILAANYRVGRLGEIDLIAAKNGRVCFIEVKTRSGETYGTPAEAVTFKKQRTIRQVAACYLKAHGSGDYQVQFDVIEVLVSKEGRLLNIRHLQEVF